LLDIVDLCAAVSPKLLIAAATWCQDERERNACLFLASRPQGTHFYELLIAQPKLRFFELLQALSSCSPSVDELINALPPLSARYYSIASSPLSTPGKISIAFSVVKFTAPAILFPESKNVLRKERQLFGVCTNWLQDTNLKHVPLFLKRSEAFSLPVEPEKPLLMIGPGTGVAPFMGFLQHRAMQLNATSQSNLLTLPGSRPSLPGSRPNLPGSRPQIFARNGAIPKPNQFTLYFGCRNHDDWLYRQEMQTYATSLDLNLRIAFSRLDTNKKVYVQHLLRDDAKLVAEHIKQGGYIYVCGDGASMAKDVHRALADVLYQGKVVTDMDKASAYLDDLKTQGRYLLDLWSPHDEFHED